ncbi:trimeric intracellular cation channel family protein [Nocardia sp. NPDC003482]|uniref:trimeric intracellular cation channel family protein n=1 Tax=Nocardia sp. NPDC004068 TaxID=3364303 RepID=UPI0036886AB7
MCASLAGTSQLDSAVTTAQQVGDRLGTFAFAVSGALLAVEKKFDIVGIVTLAAATAVGGGIVRDLVIGAHPPLAFTDLSYLGIAVVAALCVFVWHPPERLTGRPLDVADAIGLGVFCVTGTLVAARAGLGGPSAVLLGAATAVGGGALRDVLANEIPRILRRDSEIYAIPALLGATATAVLLHYGRYSSLAGTLVILAVVTVRVLALRYRWRAPRARRRS